MISRAEVQRRYENIRAAMQPEGIEALLVCGNQYSGFEGAVRYVSGFEIVHRYAYVLLSLKEEPKIIFPREARWIGDKKKPWVRDHVWAESPGAWIKNYGRDHGWKKLGIYGMKHVLAACDYQELATAPFELVPFDFQFDMARAVKSEEELVHVRRSFDLIEKGFWALLEAYKPGKTEAQIMAPCVEVFFAGGAGPRMMNIILSGTNGEAEAHFKVPGDRVVNPDDLLLYSLEITELEGYWVEFSRALIQRETSATTALMKEAYPQAMEAARKLMREGEKASSVHKAAADIFADYGFELGHLSGHSIGVTMIEHPALGANVDVTLKENMVCSFHPQVVDQRGEICLYTQDTFRIGKTEGENFSRIPWRFFSGEERPSDLEALIAETQSVTTATPTTLKRAR
ncbi:MAG: aminopeptidase P family protein [Acidobacteria bacterium]|nr:aminopeptidase P family protein [Acidobacteriota bacterium]